MTYSQLFISTIAQLLHSSIHFDMFIPALPVLDQGSLKVTSQGDITAMLSWSTPTGDYSGLIIKQCEVETHACTDHIVHDLSATNMTLIQDPDKQYEYLMVLYQDGEEVIQSQPFTGIVICKSICYDKQ